MLKNLIGGEQLPGEIAQGKDRALNVTFRLVSDQRACDAALTALGTSSGDAASIVRDLTEIVGTAGGATLPGALHGRQLFIKNAGIGTVTLYPVSTDQIDALGTAVGYALSSNGAVIMASIKDGQWYSF